MISPCVTRHFSFLCNMYGLKYKIQTGLKGYEPKPKAPKFASMWKTPAFAVCLSSVHSKNIFDLCQIHGLRTDAEKMWSANQVKTTEVTLFFHIVPGALACSRLSDRREVAKKGSAWPGEEDSGGLSPSPRAFCASVFTIFVHYYLGAWNRLFRVDQPCSTFVSLTTALVFSIQ